MALKKEGSRTTADYQFILTHADIVDLMNDQQVQLNNGNVSEDQVFEMSLVKGSGVGGEIRLRQFKPNDKLHFRFNVVTQDGTAETVNDLDVVA